MYNNNMWSQTTDNSHTHTKQSTGAHAHARQAQSQQQGGTADPSPRVWGATTTSNNKPNN